MRGLNLVLGLSWHNSLTSGQWLNHSWLCLCDAVVNFMSGCVAGTAATAVSFPFDVLRTRMIGQGKPKVLLIFFLLVSTFRESIWCL